MKEKRIFRWLAPLMLFLALMLVPGVKAQAANRTLALNNAWASGNISEGGVDFWTVTVPKAGYLHVMYQGWSIRDAYVEVWDKDLETLFWKTEVYYSDERDPKTSSNDLALEAGKYFIKVYPYGSNKGDYKLKASLTVANNQEVEPNDGFETARNLRPNVKIMGFLSMTDRCDFYKITVPFRQKVKITYTGRIKDAYYTIYNKDSIVLKEEEVYYASEEAPLVRTYEETLNRGTYYIKIRPYGDNCGRYQIKASYRTASNVKVSSLSISGKKQLAAGTSTTLKAVVSPSSASNKSVTWNSSNTSVATVSASGKVKAKLPGKTVITATAKDGSGKKKSCTVIVVPRRHTSLTTAKLSSKRAIVVWNKQKGVSGYQIQYSRNSSFSGAKTLTKSASYNAVNLSNLAKTKYYVRIRAYKKIGSRTYYGSWSKAAGLNMR